MTTMVFFRCVCVFGRVGVEGWKWGERNGDRLEREAVTFIHLFILPPTFALHCSLQSALCFLSTGVLEISHDYYYKFSSDQFSSRLYLCIQKSPDALYVISAVFLTLPLKQFQCSSG